MTQLADVVPVVEELASSGVERFRPSFVARRAGVDIAETHAALENLANAGDLDSHYELVCPNDECHRTVASYSSIDDVPLGSTSRCEACGNPFEVGLSNVWVYYTPSRSLLLRLNRDHAPEREKKKLQSWIERVYRRLAMR